MTFEEWQKTKVYWDDISDYSYAGILSAGPGLIYDDGLYIEQPANNENGTWMLTLDDEGWQTDDLLDLEHKLYTWAEDEGYFEEEEI